MKLSFDAELKGSNGNVLPVYCEVQTPHLGGQKAHIQIAVPGSAITKTPPSNPCTLAAKAGELAVTMQGVHWRYFPTWSNTKHGLEHIELLHVERLTVGRPSTDTCKQFQFHLGPVDYLRNKSNYLRKDGSARQDLFVLAHPEFGDIRFVVDWVTVYNREPEVMGASVFGGFCAIVNLPNSMPLEEAKIVEKFKSVLEVLSVLFRQAVKLHGWTFTQGSQTTTTWVEPLSPIVSVSAHEERGEFVEEPQNSVHCANGLIRAYADAEPQTRSLVRHLLLVVNPYVKKRNHDHFLSMFAALERATKTAWENDSRPSSTHAKNDEIISLVQGLIDSVKADGGESPDDVIARLDDIKKKVMFRVRWDDKFKYFLLVYPAMQTYCTDLWPVISKKKQRGLYGIRNALAHGEKSFVPVDVIAVANWHLAILMERLIFVLLGIGVPEGIRPNSDLLRHGGRGWYERDFWTPLQSKPDQRI
jgi:hypothetical protein